MHSGANEEVCMTKQHHKITISGRGWCDTIIMVACDYCVAMSLRLRVESGGVRADEGFYFKELPHLMIITPNPPSK